MEKNSLYDNIIIITDDGTECPNTRKLYSFLKSKNKKTFLYLTKEKISAKSSSISLKPIKFIESGFVNVIDCFPADCLLYCILNNSNITPENTLFIFGVNEHNHFGYGNFVSSTTSLLQIAKHFRFKAFAISSEIELDEVYFESLFPMIIGLIYNNRGYFCFNINEKSLKFKMAEISKKKIDYYEYLGTNRGPFLLITYNQNPVGFKVGTDGYYQVKKNNYIVELY